jgi:FkbM family methyltransferase
MTAHKHTFDWRKFAGSDEALKWAKRDLASIDAILPLVAGREMCVQAGGNLGVFPKYLARHFQTVITFEPAPDLFPKLTANAPEANIVRLQAALGDVQGLVGMECSRRGDRGAVHEGLTHVSGDGRIPRLRLDDFKLPVVDLLMLDLEGYELYALRGAVETITRCRPLVVVEINRNCGHYGIDPEAVRGFIQAIGYHRGLTVYSDEVYMPNEVTQ